MREARSGLNAVRVGFLSAIATLMSAGVIAAPVQYFLTVQPIDVCADDGTGCAAMNNLGTGLDNGLRLGHSSRKVRQQWINITNAIWNLPASTSCFNRPSNTTTTFQNLQVTASTTNPGRFNSAQLS